MSTVFSWKESTPGGALRCCPILPPVAPPEEVYLIVSSPALTSPLVGGSMQTPTRGDVRTVPGEEVPCRPLSEHRAASLPCLWPAFPGAQCTNARSCCLTLSEGQWWAWHSVIQQAGGDAFALLRLLVDDGVRQLLGQAAGSRSEELPDL